MKQYFNRTANSRRSLRMRTVWNILVKLMYLFSSVTSLLITDYFLQGEYIGYGRDYMNWSRMNNTMQYTVLRSKPRPRSGLLYMNIIFDHTVMWIITAIFAKFENLSQILVLMLSITTEQCQSVVSGQIRVVIMKKKR